MTSSLPKLIGERSFQWRTILKLSKQNLKKYGEPRTPPQKLYIIYNCKYGTRQKKGFGHCSSKAKSSFLLHGLEQMHCTLPLAALTRQDTAVVADDVRIYAEFLHAFEQVQSTLPLLTLFQRTDSSIEADNIRKNFLFRHTREQMHCLLPLAGFLQQTDSRVVADFIGLDFFQWHFLKQVQSLLATPKK